MLSFTSAGSDFCTSVDFSQYDHNQDGYIDNIYFFYAGKGEADSGDGGGHGELLYRPDLPHLQDDFLSSASDVFPIFPLECIEIFNGPDIFSFGQYNNRLVIFFSYSSGNNSCYAFMTVR